MEAGRLEEGVDLLRNAVAAVPLLEEEDIFCELVVLEALIRCASPFPSPPEIPAADPNTPCRQLAGARGCRGCRRVGSRQYPYPVRRRT